MNTHHSQVLGDLTRKISPSRGRYVPDMAGQLQAVPAGTFGHVRLATTVDRFIPSESHPPQSKIKVSEVPNPSRDRIACPMHSSGYSFGSQATVQKIASSSQA